MTTLLSTPAADVTVDEQGSSSQFTQAFIETIPTPGLEISAVVKKISARVKDLTGGEQIPWVNQNYTGEIYLVGTDLDSTPSDR
jgi:hypothetical protein